MRTTSTDREDDRAGFRALTARPGMHRREFSKAREATPGSAAVLPHSAIRISTFAAIEPGTRD